MSQDNKINNDLLIKGFGFSGYRSFGDELAKIGPLKKINFIVGQNNTGKSNIIKYLKEQYSPLLKILRKEGAGPHPYSELDHHLSSERLPHKISFPLYEQELEDFINSKIKRTTPIDQQILAVNLAKKLFSEEVSNTGAFWFTYIVKSGSTPQFISDRNIKDKLTPNEWRILHFAVTGSSVSVSQQWVDEVIRKFNYIPENSPSVEFISAIRKIGSKGSEANDFSGDGIINRIAKIQNPSLSSQADKAKFQAINNFAREVLDNKTTSIEIPHDRTMILVHMDGRTLPLESLGTGVHEVIILAAAATLLTKTVLCIEEPELHLHPLLQRKLIKYIFENTDNQYFFTTHSAHLLDAVEAEVFHVTHSGERSTVEAIASTKQKSNVCNDLGYKASDILQANCIIWVEGPSDRIYLNYWLKEKAPQFIEGIHYSIMFFGGRLFSHLTAVDEEDQTESIVDDLISVRKLNRNTVIVFDSDKTSAKSHLNATKKRLKNEFDQGVGFSWVTKGREIENYLDYEKIEESIKKIHPSSQGINKSEWSNLLKYRKGKNELTANKVKVARHYTTNNAANFSRLDLSEKINQLCAFIDSVNGNDSRIG